LLGAALGDRFGSTPNRDTARLMCRTSTLT
jgi:hypothetical protein